MYNYQMCKGPSDAVGLADLHLRLRGKGISPTVNLSLEDWSINFVSNRVFRVIQYLAVELVE